MLIVELFFLILLLVFVVLCFWYFLDALFCKEDYVTNNETTRKIGEFLNAYSSQKNIFYDLGSSRGGFVLDIIERCPQLQITAVDNSLIRILISQLRAFIGGKKVTFVKEDIFKTDISKVDLVYVYIPRVLLPKLATRLKKELRPGSMVITSRIAFPNWQPHKIIPRNPRNENEQDIFI